MKEFIELKFSIKKAEEELLEFEQFITGHPSLQERREILPFFREHPQLSAFIADIIPDMLRFDRLAYEYDIFGDFSADMLIGDWQHHTFCFIEFEDAQTTSIFEPSNRYAPKFSKRFEQAYGQVIDWFWKLEDVKNTAEYRHRFGSSIIDYYGIIIIGYNKGLTEAQKERLRWRQNNVIVNSKHVYILTLDKLCENLRNKLQRHKNWGY